MSQNPPQPTEQEMIQSYMNQQAQQQNINQQQQYMNYQQKVVSIDPQTQRPLKMQMVSTEEFKQQP